MERRYFSKCGSRRSAAHTRLKCVRPLHGWRGGAVFKIWLSPKLRARYYSSIKVCLCSAPSGFIWLSEGVAPNSAARQGSQVPRCPGARVP
eukprot:3001345-Pyramimonas_sp.AAC.1